MVKLSYTNPIPLYYIMEAAINPEEMSTTILRENVINTADGKKIKTITAKSVLQSFEVINWNTRRYPGEIVMESMDGNPKIQNDIRRKQFAGEFGHPDSKDMVRMAMIMPERTSHYIDKYWRQGNLLIAEVTTAPYGHGFDMYNILMSDRPWGFSLRAFGGVDSNNIAIRPMTIITYDEVNRPSHKESYATKNDALAINSFNDSLLKECSAELTLIETSTITQQITKFVLDKSDNIKIAKEIFNLHEANASIDKSTKNIILEGDFLNNHIQVMVPVEAYIKDNYLKLINI